MTCSWVEPSPGLQLHADEVHIWRAELDVPERDFARLAVMVSPDERSRANQFRFAEDGRTFLLARAILRDILSRYCEVDPSELSFAYGPHGKPMLAAGMADWLQFNCSHSQKLALYAVARRREVGIDVERIRPELAEWKVVRHFFATGEARALREFGDVLRARAFFACWTRKEAYVKARGDGLSCRLDDFEVTVDPDQPATLVHGDHQWSLQSLMATEGFASACAARGSDWKPRLWNWQQ